MAIRSGTIRGDTVLILGGLAVLGFVLYKAFDVGKKAVDTAAGAIADVFLKMFPLPPSIQLLGNVKFPGNILVPLQQLANENAVRQDENHDVFVKYSGMYWKLSPQVYGNWPATRVS